MDHTKAKTTNAATTRPNAERAWKQFEDHLIPHLRLSLVDRAVYSHLLRHSRLEGKRQLRFSIRQAARRVRISCGPMRNSLRRLAAHGVLRLLQRSNAGHVVEVRLPEEVPVRTSAGPTKVSQASANSARLCRRVASAHSSALDQIDFLKSRELRHAIHARERGLCFYCLRRLVPAMKCLDHVIPQFRFGRNSYRNLVSSCSECNSQKSRKAAPDFLRWLYREQRITATELKSRLAALHALAAGKLVPILPPKLRTRRSLSSDISLCLRGKLESANSDVRSRARKVV